jgi:AraC-like DNA-binding protein
MPWPATHFAPEPQRLSRTALVGTPTVLSVAALAGVPALVRQAFGEKVLQQANRAAMLDIELIEDRDCFIPHATMTSFLAEIERRAGEPALGLMAAPHLSLENYGCWGLYVLGGETLGAAMARSLQTIGYHSRGDRIALTVTGDVATFRYFSAARGREGYAHVAAGAVGVVLSLCRAYLPPGWRPLRVELDVPWPRRGTPFEDVFQCPVVFDAPVAAVSLEARLLAAPRRSSDRRLLTLEDVARARLEPASRADLVGVVSAQIWAQVLAGAVSIDSTARALDTSTRSLQRALHRDGADFRTLANAVRARRASELLTGTDASITEIATELGYSAPANFARAFRKATGLAPQDFRARLMLRR